ncbi:MAG TPA: hypothetical protein G4O06_06930 [Dehalococcoidia bacterium]|nr:hypothetical protein [Dehalococcoidia bacterium]
MSELRHGQARTMTQDEMQRFLKKCSYGRLGLTFQNESYVVPVSYGYSQGRILFHSVKQGKKVDFIKNNNRVCFEVDEFQKGWASVICHGTVSLREDVEAKKEFFDVLMVKSPSDEQLRRMGTSYIGIIQIEDMTGRYREDADPPL